MVLLFAEISSLRLQCWPFTPNAKLFIEATTCLCKFQKGKMDWSGPDWTQHNHKLSLLITLYNGTIVWLWGLLHINHINGHNMDNMELDNLSVSNHLLWSSWWYVDTRTLNIYVGCLSRVTSLSPYTQHDDVGW